MADLVTRLLLNSSQFDNNIRRSSQEIQQFQSIGRSVTGALTKFAGAIGIATTASEVLQKAVESNATLQGDWNDLLNTGKDVSSQFFIALANGDWSIFNNGITKAINNAKKFAKEYRNITKTLDVQSIRYEKYDAEKNRLESIIEDKNKPLAERQKAQSDLDSLIVRGITDINEAAHKTEVVLQHKLAELGIKKNIDDAQSLILDLYDPNSDIAKKTEAYRKTKAVYQNTHNNLSLGQSATMNKGAGAARKELEKYSAEERKMYDTYIRIIDYLTDGSNGNFEKLNGLFDKVNDLKDKAGTWQKDRTGARDTIRDAVREGTKKGLETGTKEAKPQIETTFVEAGAKSFVDVNRGSMTKPTSGMVGADIESGHIKSPKFILSKKDIKLNNDYADSLNNIATIMGSITNQTSKGAAAWLSYGANLLTTISSLKEPLGSLINMLAKKTIIEGAASAVKGPFGWIKAIASIAALTAAIASIPKFATGGIIDGTSFYGDNRLARVNSGEMILNRTQQGNLFNIINSGSSLNGGNVKFRIEGKDLVGVLGSYNNRTSKYK